MADIYRIEDETLAALVAQRDELQTRLDEVNQQIFTRQGELADRRRQKEINKMIAREDDIVRGLDPYSQLQEAARAEAEEVRQEQQRAVDRRRKDARQRIGW